MLPRFGLFPVRAAQGATVVAVAALRVPAGGRSSFLAKSAKTIAEEKPETGGGDGRNSFEGVGGVGWGVSSRVAIRSV